MFSRFFAVTLLGAVTLAATAAPDPKTAPAQDSSAKVICTTEHTLGSHLPKRTCATREQRDERAKADQQAMKNMHSAVKPNSTASR